MGGPLLTQSLLEPGCRLGFAEIALLATVGRPRVQVFRKPEVAILATGDEIVKVSETPRDYQIRNSNAQALAVQVMRAGGCPRILPVAPDTYAGTRELVEQGLQSDLLLLSGGVSAGKYDIVASAPSKVQSHTLVELLPNNTAVTATLAA